MDVEKSGEVFAHALKNDDFKLLLFAMGLGLHYDEYLGRPKILDGDGHDLVSKMFELRPDYYMRLHKIDKDILHRSVVFHLQNQQARPLYILAGYLKEMVIVQFW